MDKPISENANQRLEQICNRVIGPDGSSDSQVRKELRAHLEDKLLAYLGGEEKVSEEDALLLVEKHLGEPQPLRAALGENRDQKFAGEFWRRFAAITVVSVVIHLLAAPCRQLILVCWRGFNSDYVTYPIAWLADIGPNLIALAFLAWCLYRMQHQIRGGVLPWYMRLHRINLFAITVAALLLEAAVRKLPTPHVNYAWPSDHFLKYSMLAVAIIEVAVAMLWMWWFSKIRGYAFIASLLGSVAWAMEHISSSAIVVSGAHTASAYELVLDNLRAWAGFVLPVSLLAFVVFWVLSALQAVNRWWVTVASPDRA